MIDQDEVFVHTGEKTHSGTGRNRQTTNIVKILSNYELLPFNATILTSIGSSMKCHQDAPYLRGYWQEFGKESQYRVYFENTTGIDPLVVTRDGSRVVGGAFRSRGGGTLIALPWLNLSREGFSKDFDDFHNTEPEWTSAAKEWGQRFFETLASIDAAITSRSTVTPTPQWARDEEYSTNREAELSRRLHEIQNQITELEKTQEEIENEIASAGSLKALLFEQSHPLEDAVLQAMELMGFEANRFREADSEFDAVLECSEGRCIGEVEGRDNRAIGIAKMRQLQDNIFDDMDRSDVSEPAKGVLFGNAFRLSSPSVRIEEHFTAKCVTAAKRYGTALVRTCDLFVIAKALTDNYDEDFASACRSAVLGANGAVVEFPTIPEDQTNDERGEIPHLSEIKAS